MLRSRGLRFASVTSNYRVETLFHRNMGTTQDLADFAETSTFDA